MPLAQKHTENLGSAQVKGLFLCQLFQRLE